MPVDHSELSSIVKTIDDLAKRVAQMGDGAHAEHDDGSATELYAVERALNGATRRITRLIGILRR